MINLNVFIQNWTKYCKPQNFIGRSSEQVTEFIEQEVNSLLNV